jgi:aryl-alcohol dehydrogenase-like predicted oxidoreductase
LQKNITDENIEKVKKLSEIALSLDLTIAQLALAWILRRPEISCAIIGATKPEHVEENVKASGIILSKDILEQIEGILDNEPEWPLTYKPNYYHKEKMR